MNKDRYSKVYLVTGANGFVGSRLVEKIAENGDCYVIAIVRNLQTKITEKRNIEYIVCEMEQYRELHNYIGNRCIDFFIHLAWDGSAGEKRSDFQIQMKNVQCSLNAYEEAKKIGCRRFLCAGTISENIVGQVSKIKNISQNLIYAQAKKTLREFLTILSKNSNVEMVWMQFSNIYGANNTSGNLIAYTMDKLLNNEEPEYGSASEPYNFIYIDDLVDAIVALTGIQNSDSHYFIGGNEILQLKTYLYMISEIMGMNQTIGIGKRADDGIEYKESWFDISKLKKDTGFQPRYSFESGIKEILKGWDNGGEI